MRIKKTSARAYRFTVQISEDGGSYSVVPYCDNPRGLFEGAAKDELSGACESIAHALRHGWCDWAEIERREDGTWVKYVEHAA